MADSLELQNIKEVVEEFLQKMTITAADIKVASELKQGRDAVQVNLIIEDPKVLIGHQGQTLLDIARLLRIILNKKLKKDFYLWLDINDYKKNKLEYLEQSALVWANEVLSTGQQKILPAMPAFERRIIHAALSKRKDITTQSQGEGEERCVVIKPTI